MRKDFTDLTRRQTPTIVQAIPETNKQVFIKKNLAKSCGRTDIVAKAILEWLLSFETGITSKAFTAQIIRLDANDEKAVQQLESSKGKRTLSNPSRIKPPKLEEEIVTVLEEHNAIAIEASTGRKLIEEFLRDCPEIGTYILDMNELVLEYVDYSHRGKAGGIIHEANRADILIILGLEKPISLAYHIRDILYSIASVRAKDKNKYTITTWNYTHEWYIPDFKNLFMHYSI